MIDLKKFAVSLLFIISIVGTVYSGGGDGKDPNPNKDKDVQQGYNDNQREHRQRDTKDQFEVKTSHDGHIIQTEPTAAPASTPKK